MDRLRVSPPRYARSVTGDATRLYMNSINNLHGNRVAAPDADWDKTPVIRGQRVALRRARVAQRDNNGWRWMCNDFVALCDWCWNMYHDKAACPKADIRNKWEARRRSGYLRYRHVPGVKEKSALWRPGGLTRITAAARAEQRLGTYLEMYDNYMINQLRMEYPNGITAADLEDDHEGGDDDQKGGDDDQHVGGNDDGGDDDNGHDTSRRYDGGYRGGGNRYRDNSHRGRRHQYQQGDTQERRGSGSRERSRRGGGSRGRRGRRDARDRPRSPPKRNEAWPGTGSWDDMDKQRDNSEAKSTERKSPSVPNEGSQHSGVNANTGSWGHNRGGNNTYD